MPCSALRLQGALHGQRDRRRAGGQSRHAAGDLHADGRIAARLRLRRAAVPAGIRIRNAQAFDQFVDSGWEFGANAMASAQTRTQQMGSQLGVSVSPGVLMYQLSDQGAIVGVSLTGAKYYPDPNLN